MNRLKKVSIALFVSLILLGTICLAKTGTIKAPNGLFLRKEASKSGEILTAVGNKETVEILEKEGEWYKIKYNDYEGYLFAEYIETEEVEAPVVTEQQDEEQPQGEEQPEEPIQSGQSIENTEPETIYPQNIVTKSNIKVYLIPSITSKVISNIEQSKTITINYELNDWVNIKYENTEGWVRKYFINTEGTITTEPNNNIEPESNNVTEAKKGYINVSTAANVRETAGTSATVITTLNKNTEITILGEEADFYKIQYNDIVGYISKPLVSENTVTQEVTSRSAVTREENSENETEQKSSNQQSISREGDKIVEYAKTFLGYKYVSGGTTPSGGFDCTGFTYYIYNTCGYSLSRSCSVQASAGEAVAKENLQAGDLLLFNNGANGSIGHVGIYIGEGIFIHAANSRRGVVTDTINSGYYNTYYYLARRIVN